MWMLVLNHALFRKIRQHSCTALVRFLARSRCSAQVSESVSRLTLESRTGAAKSKAIRQEGVW